MSSYVLLWLVSALVTTAPVVVGVTIYFAAELLDWLRSAKPSQTVARANAA
jgi:hypothetical protein